MKGPTRPYAEGLVMERLGIVWCGVYVPRYRLNKAVISEAWGMAPVKGEKAVCNYDEDALTMAVEAGSACLEGNGRQGTGGLFFASTSGPYAEKQHSTLVAAALDLQEEILDQVLLLHPGEEVKAFPAP